MKKILLALLVLSSTVAFAQTSRQHRNNQQNTVPANVQSSFQRDHSDAQNPQWKSSNGQWHATYKDQNNHDVQTHYRSNGQSIDTHIAYRHDELPEKVRTTAMHKYHANGNYKAYRIERPNSEPIYQVKTSRQTIYLDERGNRKTYRDHH